MCGHLRAVAKSAGRAATSRVNECPWLYGMIRILWTGDGISLFWDFAVPRRWIVSLELEVGDVLDVKGRDRRREGSKDPLRLRSSVEETIKQRQSRESSGGIIRRKC